MGTFDEVTKAAEKLEILSNTILEDKGTLTPLAILWAGYTIAEAIKDAAPVKTNPGPADPFAYMRKAVERDKQA